jgi:hypothetical protein
VIAIAKTPSLNASSRPFDIALDSRKWAPPDTGHRMAGFYFKREQEDGHPPTRLCFTRRHRTGR